MMTDAETVEVELGGRTVRVPADGLFARYRMNADLDVVEPHLRVRSADFFRTLPKTTVEPAIETTHTPNFHYARWSPLRRNEMET